MTCAEADASSGKGAALGDGPDAVHLPCTLDGVLSHQRRGKGEARCVNVIRAQTETIEVQPQGTQSGDAQSVSQTRVPVSQSDASGCIAEVRVVSGAGR